jgi:hypothetical protein
VQGLASARVARFLLSKAGKPLTLREFEQITKVLKLAVGAGTSSSIVDVIEPEIAHVDSSPVGVSLQLDPILKQALEMAEKAAETAEEPFEQPYMGTVITSIPPGEKYDIIIPQTFGLKPASKTKGKSDEKSDEKDDKPVSTPATKHYSPAPSFGLPQLEPPEDPRRPPSPERVIPPEEVAEEDKLRVLMANPYERLCTFRNRKVQRKVVSVEDLAAIRKQRGAAREDATRLKVEAERREAEEAKKAEGARIAADVRDERRHDVSVLGFA